ncbi:hypothetical protein [Acidithiobacillus thiooxidans]|uniref:hypothetical protein n=1 Tax=Acidithiobacillus thiooxidans TaxID=930 RepID=UPI00242DC59A|nr:hypothetical protein [Acidithiobacillus thiooxidans]
MQQAILKRPRLFVLDEATSALDSATEKTILDNLARTTAGMTTIMIAHRLSTIRTANEILVIDHGKITGFNGPALMVQRSQLQGRRFRRVHPVGDQAIARFCIGDPLQRLVLEVVSGFIEFDILFRVIHYNVSS